YAWAGSVVVLRPVAAGPGDGRRRVPAGQPGAIAMTSTAVFRNAVLLLALLALAGTALAVRPERRERAAALLAFAGAAVGLAALNAVAVSVGWWRFADVPASFLTMPTDLWLGWAVLWGPLPVLIRAPAPAVLLALAWLDLLTMPRMAPLVQLGPSWLVGEAVGLVAVALPAMLLGRWTARSRHLVARAGLQVLLFAALIVWLIPTVAIEIGDGSWQRLIDLPRWQLSLVVQAALVVSLPGIAAVREFVTRGGGTPYPWDPPVRLVTTGPYAYVANPMQVSGVGLLVLAAFVTGSWSVLAAAVVATAFATAVAGPHERHDLARRHGAAWLAYRGHVRDWWPRWRPYTPASATLLLADSCDVCAATAVTVRRLDPASLRILPAEEHAAELTRACYEGPDGHRAVGVAAIARALEHVNLAWAIVGWTLRAPVLGGLAQFIVDGLG